MDKVSIIAPAYNAAAHISETIESVISQSYDNWEMIITDDCSTDSTRDVIQKYSEHDGRIKYLKNSENTGPAGARNNSLKHATGKYIAFLDSDDLWVNDKLERQIGYMKNNNLPFTYTEYRRISSNSEKTGRLIKVPDSLNYSALLKNTAIATSTVVLDRDAVGEFSMTETYYDDFVLWLEILKRGFTAHGIHEDMMRYRVLEKSVSRNKVNSSKMVWKTYRDIEKIGLPYSLWCFVNYAVRGYMKYKNF